MGEQALDVRSAVAGLRRNRGALIASGLVGAGVGAAFVVLQPPLYASSSQVLLPPAQDANGQSITRDIDTATQLAGSDVVLEPVAAALEPPQTVSELSERIEIGAPTRDVLEFTAYAATPDEAQELARALTESEVAYVNETATSLTTVQEDALESRRSALRASLKDVTKQIEETTARGVDQDSAGAEANANATALAQLTAEQANLVLQIDQVDDQLDARGVTASATVIQEATPAERPALIQRIALLAAIGLCAGLLLAATVAIMFSRRDRRLRYRDEIADAIGTTVVGSVHTVRPRTAAGWAALLSDYTPETVDSWALRQTLRYLAESDSGSETTHRRLPVPHPRSLTVLSLAGDQRALSVGPLLASYAASIGIDTRLVTTQGHASAATLWAMVGQHPGEEPRPGLVVDNGAPADPGELTVALVVVDPSDARLDHRPATECTVLAVSPGALTAEDLALVAMVLDDAGGRIDGIVVADPEDLDRTTGRLLQRERVLQGPLPVRLTGVPSADAHGDVADIRRGRR